MTANSRSVAMVCTNEDRTVLVSGTANQGDTVVVVIGDKTQTTTTGTDGTWEVIFTGPNFPNDGTYTADVTVIGDTETKLTGPDIIIDTTPPPLAITSGTTASGEIITESEFDGGATVTGTTEIGASVVLIAGGVSHVADVDAQGNWSVTLSSSTFERGEYISDIRVIATDSFNNSTTINDGIEIDTVSGVTVNTTTIETDGIINADERSDGVQITGTTDPGSTVVVEMNGYTRTAFVDAQGNWNVTFIATEIPVGERDLTINATATDQVGNTSAASGEVRLDTWVRNFDITSQAGGADGIVNADEAMQGMTVTGTTEPGASVSVTLGGISRAASVDANGNWTVTYLSGELPAGEQTATLTASSTDLAGNTATETRSVIFDTDAGLLTISPEPVETDDIVNQVEASDGVMITGTSTPNQMVDVTLDGVSRTVQTDSFGVWRANYAAGEIRPGEYEAQITAHTVDAAGNALTRSDTVMVDTFVRNFAVSSNPVTADNIVNDAEQGQGVTLSGTTEPGATVTVVVEDVSRVATVAANGNWTASFPAFDLPDGHVDHHHSADQHRRPRGQHRDNLEDLPGRYRGGSADLDQPAGWQRWRPERSRSGAGLYPDRPGRTGIKRGRHHRGPTDERTGQRKWRVVGCSSAKRDPHGRWRKRLDPDRGDGSGGQHQVDLGDDGGGQRGPGCTGYDRDHMGSKPGRARHHPRDDGS